MSFRKALISRLNSVVWNQEKLDFVKSKLSENIFKKNTNNIKKNLKTEVYDRLQHVLGEYHNIIIKKKNGINIITNVLNGGPIVYGRNELPDSNDDILYLVNDIGEILYNKFNKKSMIVLQTDSNDHKAISFVFPRSERAEANFTYIESSGIIGGSNPDVTIYENTIISMEVIIIRQKEYKKKIKNGAFLKYLNPTIMNLERYGLYNDYDDIDLKDSCFIQAVFNHECITNDEVLDMKQFIKRRNIRIKDILEFSKKFNICVKVVEHNPKDNKLINHYYNKEAPRKVDIAYLDNHYFTYEQTQYSQVFVDRYSEILDFCNRTGKDINDYKNNKLKFYKTRNGCGVTIDPIKSSTSSLTVLRTLINNKTLIPMSNEQMSKIPYNDIFDESEYTEFGKNDVFDVIEPKKENKKIESVVIADFESSTDQENRHIAYMLSYSRLYIDSGKCRKYNTIYSRVESDILKEFFNNLVSGDVVYFHNLKYDVTFIMPYIGNIITRVEKDGNLFSLDCISFGKRVVFKDSLKIIPVSLKELPKMFEIEEEKEIMPYDLYSTNFISRTNEDDIICVKEAEKYLSESDYKKFAEKHQNNTFQPIKYAKYYCERDVEVLAKSMYKFYKATLELLNINIFNHLSISSIADTYFINEGCYEDVSKVSGLTKLFIERSVVGGRVMTRNNVKQHIKVTDNDYIQDFDGVSLYPSAMSTIVGFPKGVATEIKDTKNYDLNNYNNVAYFVQIRILQKHYDSKYDYAFPILYDRGDGSIDYTNYPKNREFVFNPYQIMDCIKYYGWVINEYFEIIKGIEFLDGYNKKINESITKIFKERIKYKEASNESYQQVLKLIMNSSYGKTILKSQQYKTVIYKKDSDELHNYIDKNYQNIHIIEIMNGFCFIKVHTTLNDGVNRAHCGSIILGRSKQIMNDVFIKLEEGDGVYYTDTDSIHVKSSQIDKLPKEFIGKNLCQFHSDFSSKNLGKGCIVSSELITLGKKCYIDKLINIDNPDAGYDYHFRMKGIPNDVVINTAMDRKQTIMELYKDLYNGIEIEFNLLNSSKPKFEFVNGVVRNKLDFTRRLKF